MLLLLLWLLAQNQDCLTPPKEPGLGCVIWRKETSSCVATCFCSSNPDGGYWRRSVSAENHKDKPACTADLEDQCQALRKKGCR